MQKIEPRKAHIIRVHLFGDVGGLLVGHQHELGTKLLL